MPGLGNWEGRVERAPLARRETVVRRETLVRRAASLLSTSAWMRARIFLVIRRKLSD